ncbi:MAG: aminotransferase class I/II-fold pyridoxal phosphate-dependent enzyme, partial [Candidatus Limnocylindrales bacterium]
MDYRRMAIEIESPEQFGYERIRCNLAESSVADMTLRELGLGLDDLVLQYGDHLGHPGLRQIVAGDGPGLTAADVLLTPGAAAALFFVATSLLGPSDRVVVARPNYATNLETPRAIGAEVAFLDLRYEDGWAVDLERLRALLTPETRLLSLTSPHNPTGQCLSEATLREIVAMVEAHGRARLLLDETYREMTYGPMLPPVASLSERAIGVSSLSKTYGLPGIRMGWLTTRDHALLERLLAAKEQILITNSVVDEAIGFAALSNRARLMPAIRERIATALGIVRSWLAADPRFEWHEPQGGVVGFPRSRQELAIDPATFHAVLFERYGTVVGPGHWFDQSPRHFRLGYGWPTADRLREGLANLSAAADNVAGHHEYRVARAARDRFRITGAPFALDGGRARVDVPAVRRLAARMDVDAGQLLAAGLLHESLHRLADVVGGPGPDGEIGIAAANLEAELGRRRLRAGLAPFVTRYPTAEAYRDAVIATSELAEATGRAEVLEETLLRRLADRNPALTPFRPLFDDGTPDTPAMRRVAEAFESMLATVPAGTAGDDAGRLLDALTSPAHEAPQSLAAQLRLIRDRWADALGDDLLDGLQLALDVLAEQERAQSLRNQLGVAGPAESVGIRAGTGDPETVAFSADRDWMPGVVLIAKSTHVWLEQLSRAYGRNIGTLDAIPDEELATLARRGINGLWLIGLWQRSRASAEIKQRMGDADAAASAYALDDYRIADDLGGEAALVDLRERAWRHGIRLSSDMVPNHMGLDARWVVEHPDRFISLPEPPIPGYTFSGPDLSPDERVAIRLEDGYWDRSDAAVVFERVDSATGERRYVYHGNDGTSLPWNDTAQLDFIKPEVREAVIATILDVARRSPIIRFDAAMTLARRHVQRLWYPPPGGGGGAIPTRVGHGLSRAAFERAMPGEFWREVVDRVAAEAPDTLLVAEAFWMLEGYFVRTLGMHRVYNSAFMHMLRDERNAEYRALIRETLAFDPEVLKRFVNFLNNPDERTALDQFGDGDRYFCAATLLVTMPGLPMFGHGQIEGYAEKYGMEFRRARWDEQPNGGFVERHEREIFPLLRRRSLFAEARDFRLFDLVGADGAANDDVFAFTNRRGDDRALVLVHPRYAEARGIIRDSVPFAVPGDAGAESRSDTLAGGLALPADADGWVVFRDHVSGLEELHACARLHERGLEVELGAYERRVYLDWRVLRDHDGLLAGVADRLQGRRVASIDAELEAMRAESVAVGAVSSATRPARKPRARRPPATRRPVARP